jgi:hypothetical protein
MNNRQHALWARSLIAECGGLDESAAHSRVGKSLLSAAQTPNGGVYLAADVICDLELYCGKPVYTRAMLAALAAEGVAAPAGDLTTEICEAAEKVVDVQGRVRRAMIDGALTPREQQDLLGHVTKASEELHQVGALLRGEG